MHARAAATTIALAALLGASSATAQPTGDGNDSVVSTCVRSFENAQIEQKKGRLVSAVESYRSCARQECPALVRTDCVQALDVAERALPTVSLIVRDRAGRDVDVAITLDDKPIEAGKGKAIPVDPGDHVVGFEAGGRRQIRSFTAHEGEKSRLVVLAFEDGVTEQAVAERPTQKRRSIWPWVLGGAGVVAVTAGTVMVLGYEGKESRLRERFEAASRCDGDGVAGCSAEEAARRDQLKEEYVANEQRASDATPVALSFIIGGTLAIAGAVVWMVLDRPAATPRSAILVPTFARGGPGGVLELAF